MARWDEILTLPVQNPPTLEFSAADIVWSRVEGWREKMDRLALIPFSRVNDFVRGESNNKECPTRFHVEARRRRPPESAYKPKVDGILEYILYWCSFGPDDHRKGGLVRPSRSYASKRKTPAGRPNTKRGCVCHFIVKRLIAEPSVALIIYNQDKHVDKKGAPCHGPMDKKAVGTQAMFAPYISDELRLQIMSLLYVGVPVETIMQKHTEMVQKQGGPCSRDDLLSHRYVRRLERKIRRSTYKLDSDDDISIGMWIESHQDHIFFYEDFSDSDPFVLGIQTEWQLQQMIRFGNRSLMASDSRFGTNKLKYPIHSLLVFDSNNNAIPVAWIITPNFANSEVHRWMGALYDRVHTKDPTWQLGGFIVDDPLADLPTIRDVFRSSVLISLWRVSHAWRKHLMNKCSDAQMLTLLSRRLGEAISGIGKGYCSMDFFDGFLEEFVDCSEFLDYFKSVWIPRIGAWIDALKSLPMASAEVSSAIECYHHQLKLRLLNEKDPTVYLRADWLVDKLGTKVHSYYWLDEYSGKDNFSRYWKDEWQSGLTSWRLALQIPDSDVVINGACAKVVNQRERKNVNTVLNVGSEFALCDCDWSRMGNLCEHIIKSTNTCRLRGLAASSTSLFNYKQCLLCILNCPPYDSVIRDHAVTLAVSVKSQLNVLLNLENVSPITDVQVTRDKLSNTSTKSSAMGSVTGDGDSGTGFQSVSETADKIRLKESDPTSFLDSSEMETQIDKEVDAVVEDRDHQFVATSFMETESADNGVGASSNRSKISADVDGYGLDVPDQINSDIVEDIIIKKESVIGPSSTVGLPFSSRPDMLEASKEDKGVIIASQTLSSHAMAIDSFQIEDSYCSSLKEPFSVRDYLNCLQNANVHHNDEETITQIGVASENQSNEMIEACTFECHHNAPLSPNGNAETMSEAKASEKDLKYCSETAKLNASSSANTIQDVCVDQIRHASPIKEKESTDDKEDLDCDMHKSSAEPDKSMLMDLRSIGVDRNEDESSSIMDIDI